MKPTANPKRTLIESLQVGLAWDSQIKKWAERELPNGEVVGRIKNAQTVNYKTLKPVKDGLFCEKIFGPIKDFECACGFKQTRGGFCPQCNVEFTRSEVRRYRLGYFQLPSAVTHVWYLRGR
ncbi:MAG: DNA-directed RNA polymerase subunit gamma, partial [Rickettsiaceae bacterium]